MGECMNIGIFDSLPMWVIYIGMTLTLLLSFEVGYQISNYTAVHDDKEGFNSTGPMVGGLLAMLAFVLAFTFSMASSQHNLRKVNVLKEANIIGTAYLRADLIGDRDETKIKQLIKEYVDIRLYAIQMGMAGINRDIVKKSLTRSVEIQEKLWAQASSVSKKEPNINTGLFVQSINDIIDVHQKRVTAGLYNRIPSSVLLILLIISILTMMTMGSQAKLAKSRRLTALIPLILAFTALTTVVIDLDRPFEGMITVGQEAMIDLQSSLNRTSK